MFFETTLDAFAAMPTDRWAPVVRERPADLVTPVGVALRLFAPGQPAFLLESAEGGETVGRYSLLGVNPSGEIGREGGTLDDLRAFVAAHTVAETRLPEALPAGAVGYLAYDGIRLYERIPDRHDDHPTPNYLFFHFRDLVVFDHLKQRVYFVTLVGPDEGRGDRAYADALVRLDALEWRSTAPIGVARRVQTGATLGPLTVQPDDATFEQQVRDAREYILSGDVFQVVLSRSFSRPFDGDPMQVYRALRMINPSPFMFYVDTGDHQLIGASPEDLVRVSGDRVETLPIAGTRKRGADDAEDAALADDLRADPKEQAEHLMLVDLARNDIGRVAQPGTVEVEALMTVEKYSHVMHLVSRVVGRLRPDIDALQALMACFPAGTVSGAPKIRAMEIIDEMEPTARGVYAGSVCYFDGRGNLDSCIAIRTLFLKDGIATVNAGAGLVADSVPAHEEAETRNKARAVLAALEAAGRLPAP